MNDYNTPFPWPELGWKEGRKKGWKVGPDAETVAILDRALELVSSVPYTVTLRWLFYNLWQEGYYPHQKESKKKSAKALAYGNFDQLMSRLRHSSAEWQERFPIEVADDRRDPIHYSSGYRTPDEWLSSVRDRLVCHLDTMVGQERYVMVAFEAQAMQSQFIHYTRAYGVSLWPFSGAASIAYKKRLADRIAWAYHRFGLPVVLLYFGDLDDAGELIPETAFCHVRKWCPVPFDAYRVGLNREQVQRYGILDDPEKPGKYQWEAVPDDAAREIITGALDTLVRQGVLTEVLDRGRAATAAVMDALAGVELP